MNRLFLLLLTAFMLSACTGDTQKERELIYRAEQIMQEKPDSALHILQSINWHSLRGELRARYALIYSIAQDKSGIDVANDSLLRIAHEYYSQHPDDSLYARSQYYMGKYLWLTDQTDSAYNCLLKARTTSEEKEDYYTAYLATDRMRRITEVSDTALCLRLSKEAYRLYQKHGADNLVNEAYLLLGIGDTYFRRNEVDSVIHYYNKALDKAKSAHDSMVVSDVYQNISRYYSYNKQYETALNYAQQSLNYNGSYDMSLLLLFAQCYTENGELEKAQQYLSALPPAEIKEAKLARFRVQHRLSLKNGGVDASQEYFDSACNVAADMYLSAQKDKLGLHRKNMQKEMERQQAEFRGKLFAASLGFSVVILFLIVWLFVKYRRSKKVEIAHQKKQNRILEELNKKEKERFYAEEKRFRAEEALLRQEKMHKEQMMEQTRNYVKKMIGILRKLEEHRKETAIQDQKNKHNPRSKGTKKDKYRMKIDEKEWDELQAYLEACDDSFVTRFKNKFSDISKEDYQLCLLLRCGFTNSDLDMVYLNGMQVIKNKQNLAKERLSIKDQGLSLREYIKQF